MNGRMTIEAGERCSFGVPLILVWLSYGVKEDVLNMQYAD